MPRIFIGAGARPNDQMPTVGFWERQQLAPHQLRGLGVCCELHQRVRAEPRPPKGFPLFSALRMASPDTIILLIVDYHAAIGGKIPVPPPLAYAPGPYVNLL